MTKYTVMNDYGFGNNVNAMEFESYELAEEEYYIRKAHEYDDVIIIDNETHKIIKDSNR